MAAGEDEAGVAGKWMNKERAGACSCISKSQEELSYWGHQEVLARCWRDCRVRDEMCICACVSLLARLKWGWILGDQGVPVSPV